MHLLDTLFDRFDPFRLDNLIVWHGKSPRPLFLHIFSISRLPFTQVVGLSLEVAFSV